MREDVLKQRYYMKDENGQPIEDWAGLSKRVANAIANNKNESKEFYNIIYNCDFLPNSPALMNAGKNKDFSMSACFVLPIEDSMDGIFSAVKNAALVHKMGGGTGFDFSKLRPEGEIVKTTKQIASGPCSFIRVFDTATDVVKQGGVRRGANMGILRVDHPDIEKFISLKEKEGTLSNFNISIAITDEFMNAVKTDKDFHLKFKGEIKKTVKARKIWQSIIEHAWANGEPGIIFIDKINKHNTTPLVGKIEATNPCGEQPLLPYEACVLGSINLAKHVKDNSINWKKLENTIKIGITLLDNIIDKQSYPLPEIEQMHKSNRKIGLGIMGWADMLLLLGIKYDSDDALELAEKIMSFIEENAIKTSQEIAKEKGVFPNWEKSIWKEKNIPIRNATVTTIAPTGSISIIANCSSGIEPIFAWETIQKRPIGEHKIIHPIYAKWKKENPDKDILPDYFVNASQISPEWHIKIQASFQKYVQNAVSKTVNLPNSATKEDIEKIFITAYNLDCKGVTVYRDGSRYEQVISSTTNNNNTNNNIKELELNAIEEAKRIRVKTNEGNVYVIITHRGETPLEVFINSPVESKYAEVYEALARIFSTALRYKIPLNSLIEQLEKANQKFGSIISPVYALIKAFRMLGMNGHEKCPDCKSQLIAEEGCLKCPACGFSKC